MLSTVYILQIFNLQNEYRTLRMKKHSNELTFLFSLFATENKTSLPFFSIHSAQFGVNRFTAGMQ